MLLKTVKINGVIEISPLYIINHADVMSILRVVARAHVDPPGTSGISSHPG